MYVYDRQGISQRNNRKDFTFSGTHKCAFVKSFKKTLSKLSNIYHKVFNVKTDYMGKVYNLSELDNSENQET